MSRFRAVLVYLILITLLLGACSSGAEVAPATQQETAAAPADAAPAAVPATTGDVPRNRTVIVAQKTSYPPGEMWSLFGEKWVVGQEVPA